MISKLLTIEVLATVALVAVLVKCETELYPDVSCLPDLYDTQTRKGIATVERNALICKYQKGKNYNWQNCSKSCAWMRLEIANWTTLELQSVEQNYMKLHMNIVMSADTAKATAKRMSKCDGALKAVANLPCEECDEFNSCMETALAANGTADGL